MHIFVAEDEKTIRRELTILLENAMYQVTAPENFENIPDWITEASPDLILLDVNLPGMSGFDICSMLRQRENSCPVIFLTSRTDSMDELNGMLRGGDDYITKPYQAPILLARIAAVLKRTRGNTEKTSYSYENVRLDLLKCTISCDEKEVELTKNEMKILHLLFMHAGNYVARQDLIESLWDNQIFIDDNTLSVHVTRIREKLRELGRDNFIQTKRGMGYRI